MWIMNEGLFLKGLIRKLARGSAITFIGAGALLGSCSSGSGQNAVLGTRDMTGAVAAGSTIGTVTPLPTDPCSYFPLTTAEHITRSRLTQTINGIERAVGYSVCQYSGSRRNVNVDIKSIRPGSSSALITEILMRPFEGFLQAPGSVRGLGQEGYTDREADPDNGYINLVYVFTQDGLVVETIAVVGTSGASDSEATLLTAEFSMAAHL
jgi:hypothetical protein